MFLSRYSIAEHLNEHALDLGIAAEFIQENGGGGGEIERGRGFRLCAGKRLPYGWNVTQPHVNVYQREGWNIFATAAAGISSSCNRRLASSRRPVRAYASPIRPM